MRDKRISSIEHDADGWWVYLADGWQNGSDPGCHAFHEDTKREALAAFRAWVKPCECQGCKR